MGLPAQVDETNAVPQNAQDTAIALRHQPLKHQPTSRIVRFDKLGTGLTGKHQLSYY